MLTKLEAKQKEIELRQQQVLRLQEEIALLRISAESKPVQSLHDRFPLGRIVSLSGKNEKHRLRKKRAVIVGHTAC